MSNLFGPFVVERRPVEFTTEEQSLLASYKYQDLKKFEFLVRLPQGEGDMRGGVTKVSIAGLDPGHFPNEELVGRARAMLMKRDGIPIATALAEIRARRDPQQAVHGGVKAAAIPASGDAD
jgi:hypothetical protein